MMRRGAKGAEEAASLTAGPSCFAPTLPGTTCLGTGLLPCLLHDHQPLGNKTEWPSQGPRSQSTLPQGKKANPACLQDSPFLSSPESLKTLGWKLSWGSLKFKG